MQPPQTSFSAPSGAGSSGGAGGALPKLPTDSSKKTSLVTGGEVEASTGAATRSQKASRKQKKILIVNRILLLIKFVVSTHETKYLKWHTFLSIVLMTDFIFCAE